MGTVGIIYINVLGIVPGALQGLNKLSSFFTFCFVLPSCLRLSLIVIVLIFRS